MAKKRVAKIAAPVSAKAVINTGNYLNISRHISHIKNQSGNNWLALALEQVQTAVRGLQKASS